MSEQAATHSGSTILLLGHGQSLSSPEQAMEISMALRGVSPGGFLGSSGVPTALGLEHAKRLHTQQQVIATQRQIIANQYQEIRRLQQLVNSMPQERESAADATVESEEDLELDYSAMDAQANVEMRPGVNWGAVPRTTTYSEYFDAPYELDAEER